MAGHRGPLALGAGGLDEEPTTAAVAGDRLLILASPQLHTWAYDGPQRAPLSAFRPIVILIDDEDEVSLDALVLVPAERRSAGVAPARG